ALSLLKTVEDNVGKKIEPAHRAFLAEAAMRTLSYPALFHRHTAQTKDVCERMEKVASAVWETDTDPADPNIEPKPLWPSAVMEAGIVANCARSDHALAERLIEQTEDPDIRLLLKINRAIAELDPAAKSVMVHQFAIKSSKSDDRLGGEVESF
ncbi:MAG TPA: hypothetical protein VGC88_01715, partial [Terriglobales bacterium]